MKYFIWFIFWKKNRRKGRYIHLYDLDYNVVKFLKLFYTTEEIVKIDDIEFEILQKRRTEFFCHYKLSHLLYCPNINKAVDILFRDPDNDGSYKKFIQNIQLI